MLLKIEKMNKSYNEEGGKKLLIFNDLNFTLHNEKIITRYGPSGIGKTTFLNMLGTVDLPDSGDIYLDDIQYNKKNYQILRRKYIGYMFQFHYLLPEFTVFENLSLTLEIKKTSILSKKETKELIYNTLSDFNVESKANHYPNQLSGGEKQRISLIRAVINNPVLVLADEPTGNLDSENANILINQIKEISERKNIKFIIATHNKAFEKIANSIYNIENHTLVKKIL